MSIRPRRTATDSRDRMLAAARRLLVEQGPAALTLAEVAADMGVRHTNVLHHFGSAAGLRAALIQLIVEEAGGAAEEAIRQLRAGRAPIAGIVEALFDAFASQGLARLLAWATLADGTDALERLNAEVATRIGRIALDGPPGSRDRLARAAQLLIGQAFAEALLGEGLSRALGREEGSMRTDLVHMLQELRRS